MTTTAPASSWTTPWPPLPSWEIASLQDAATNGQLSGVPPQLIAVIASAESSGKGGSINSKGYGGFFGLGVNKTYPGGMTTTAMLQGTDPQSFAEQAQIAASAFASYLQTTGGNPVTAEQIYQTGSASGAPGEGAKLMAQYSGGSTVPLSSLTAAPATTSSTTCTPVIGEGGVLGVGAVTLLNSCQAQEIVGALLMIVGAGALVVGFGIILADVGLKERSSGTSSANVPANVA
jgi:hypothetical protein